MRKHSVIFAAVLCMATVVHASVPQKLSDFHDGERVIYGRLIEAYRHNQLAETIHQREILARNFPKSVHLDNAYYLTGLLQFQNNRLAEAVRDFGIVADHFPRSNKRPSALFAKAVTYGKLGLKPQAVRIWKMIMSDYPGSVESQRASLQLKAINLESTNKVK